MVTNYLISTQKLFTYYRSLGDNTFAQLSDEGLFHSLSPGSNSIGIIVNHLNGNMLSRWTDFLHSDGEKKWRKRDQEFESEIDSRNDLLAKWNEGWECLFKALASISEENFEHKVFIRNQEHSIQEALNRQLCHYAYHVGQIVFIGTIIKGPDWKSLSISKGRSQAFNDKKESQGKHGGHFTDGMNDTL